MVLVSVVGSHAALEFYESFNYPTAGVQLSSAGSPSWGLYTGGGVDPKIAAGSLSYPGLVTSAGDNSLTYDGLGGTATGLASRNLSQTYNIGNVSTLYYSLTFKVTAISATDWGGSAANYNAGSFMAGFSQKLSNGTALTQPDVGAPLLIRTGNPANTGGTANGFQQYQLGTGITASTTTSPTSRVFDGANNYNIGDTLFLVLSYTFGAGTADDVAKLYVNPTPGSLEGANTPVVSATAFTDIANNQIQSFFLRNNSVEPQSTVIDDLRVGTTWSDVTPAPVPEPSSISILILGLTGALIRRKQKCKDSRPPAAAAP